jgi:hypothetical protein
MGYTAKFDFHNNDMKEAGIISDSVSEFPEHKITETVGVQCNFVEKHEYWKMKPNKNIGLQCDIVQEDKPEEKKVTEVSEISHNKKK